MVYFSADMGQLCDIGKRSMSRLFPFSSFRTQLPIQGRKPGQNDDNSFLAQKPNMTLDYPHSKKVTNRSYKTRAPHHRYFLCLYAFASMLYEHRTSSIQQKTIINVTLYLDWNWATVVRQALAI